METATYEAVLLGGNGLDRTGTSGYCQARKGKVNQAKSIRQSSIGGPGQLCKSFSGSTPISLRIHPLLVPLPPVSEHICVGS